MGAFRLSSITRPVFFEFFDWDELSNQDVKSNALGRRHPGNQTEMTADVRSYLHSTQKRPDIVKSYFEEERVNYAAK